MPSLAGNCALLARNRRRHCQPPAINIEPDTWALSAHEATTRCPCSPAQSFEWRRLNAKKNDATRSFPSLSPSSSFVSCLREVGGNSLEDERRRRHPDLPQHLGDEEGDGGWRHTEE
uniref:Uncharacterized protein n=2 Tax=Oryza TaxID=4527 RepID=A0A0E0PYU1_ORYRU